MISIIIPVYNEAVLIEQQLFRLKKQISQHNYVKEIWVVDGGSKDQTKEIASTIDFINLVNSEKGRAKQMNAGAVLANQPILYFLHIDSTPPPNFDLLIVEQVKNNHPAGCFCMKFNSHHPWLILMSWLTKLNHSACRGGDQSLFITKKLFEAIGGYDETYPIYEDNILITALYKRKKFTVIQSWLTTSPRLYQKIGVWRLQWIYINIYYLKWRGANPNKIYAYFKEKISTT